MTDNWAIFLSFYPTNEKKRLEIPSFNSNVPQIMIICYTVPEIWRMKDLIYIFHLGYFLPFYTPNGPKNQLFKKMGKTPGNIIILHVYQKLSHDVRFLSYGARQTDG